MNELANREVCYPIPTDTQTLVDRWIAFADVKPTTEKNYRKAVKQFVKYLAENGIQNPTRETVKEWKDWLLDNRSAGTAQLYITAIKIWFRWLEQEGIYPNVTDHLKSPKGATKGHKRDAMNVSQIRKLLATIDRKTETGKRDYAMLLTMFSTCLRTVSISKADIKDLEGFKDWLKDHHSPVRLYYQGKGKTDKSIPVKLETDVLEALEDYLRCRKNYSDNDPLFAGASRRIRNERLRTESISRIFKTRCRQAGIESARITAHSARHSGATIALKAGSTLEEVQQLLGHESITTTMIYIHDINREKNESEKRILNAIFSD